MSACPHCPGTPCPCRGTVCRLISNRQNVKRRARRVRIGKSDPRLDFRRKSRGSRARFNRAPNPEPPHEDEDDEGRSESEQLVDRGVEEAERDQIAQAAQAAGKKGEPEP